MDFGAVAELGVTGMLVVAVIMLIDFIKNKFREHGTGDRRNAPAVINCPNKIEGLAATIIALSNESREQTRLNTDQLQVLQHNQDGIDRLVDQHKPGVDGREMWKTSTRSEKVQEESRDLLRELVSVVKKNGFK